MEGKSGVEVAMRLVISSRRVLFVLAGFVLLLAVVISTVSSFPGDERQADRPTPTNSTDEGSPTPISTAHGWVVTDLGTLGGGESEATALNDRGQIVGRADTKSRDEDGSAAFHAFLWEHGRMRDLGTLGGRNSEALAINDRGQTVGWADTKAKDNNGEQIAHAFLWENGRMHDLGTLGGPSSSASDINSRGQVVGRADTKALDEDSYPGTHAAHAFLWENGRMRDLGTFGGSSSQASAISEDGRIVGSADTEGTIEEFGTIWPLQHAFLWQGGRIRDLGTLYGRRSAASDINRRGQVVGSLDTGKKDAGSKYGDEPIWHAFLWQRGRLRDLTPGGVASAAEAINDRAQIAGAWWKLGNSGSDPWDEAVLWRGGEKMVRLGGLLPIRVSRANAINERGQVAGWSITRDWDAHAVLWTLKR